MSETNEGTCKKNRVVASCIFGYLIHENIVLDKEYWMTYIYLQKTCQTLRSMVFKLKQW